MQVLISFASFFELSIAPRTAPIILSEQKHDFPNSVFSNVRTQQITQPRRIIQQRGSQTRQNEQIADCRSFRQPDSRGGGRRCLQQRTTALASRFWVNAWADNGACERAFFTRNFGRFCETDLVAKLEELRRAVKLGEFYDDCSVVCVQAA